MRLTLAQVDEHYNAFVIDFGVSRVATFDPKDKMTLVGTPTYMAPEVLDARPYDEKADTYSFAFVLWSMVRFTIGFTIAHCQDHWRGTTG